MDNPRPRIAISKEALQTISDDWGIPVVALEADFTAFLSQIVLILRTKREVDIYERYELAGSPFGSTVGDINRWYESHPDLIPESTGVIFETGYGRQIKVNVYNIELDPPLDEGPTLQEIHAGV